MKILVTGGAGFIGSHTVDLCVAQNLEVVVVDDLSRGKQEYINKEAKFYQLDVRSDTLPELIQQEEIDTVIHLAAQTDVQVSMQNVEFDASVNILGTLNVLEASKKAGVKKIVYASSAAVYGNPVYLPVDEQHPLLPQSGYGISKYVPEMYLAQYKAVYGLDFTVLRYANVYGPRQDATGEGGVVAIFADKLSRGQTPVIYGDGEQTRDFVYVGDVAKANYLALRKGSGNVHNVSTAKTTSVNTLFSILSELMGSKVTPVYAEARVGDIKDSFLANETLGNVFGWKPNTDLRNGLKTLLGQN